MELKTRKECIEAMLEGKTVIDAYGEEWIFKDDEFCMKEVSWSLHMLKLPATIKEEPELLYEVMEFDNGRWTIRGYLETESTLTGYTKTGRVFELVNGKPRLKE